MFYSSVVLDYSLRELWQQNADFSVLQSVFIGLIFLLCDIVLCVANEYIQLGSILEVGYPKRTKKQKQQWNWAALREHAFLNKLFLWRLCREAPRKHLYLWVCFVLNGMNVLVLASVPVAYVGLLLTKGAGWSVVLLIFVPISYLMLSVAVMFIPSILWLPSERKRYRR